MPPETVNQSPSRNMTSSPSGKNKRFSFLPTTGLSLWGNNTSLNKSMKIDKAAAEKKEDRNPVSNIHGTYSSDNQGEIEASSLHEIEDEVNMINNQNVTEEGRKQSTEVNKESMKEEVRKGVSDAKEEKYDSNEEQIKYKLNYKKEGETQQNKEPASHKNKDSSEKEEEKEEEEEEDDEFEEYNSSSPNFSMVQEPMQPMVSGIKKSTLSTSHTGNDDDNLLEL